MDAADVNNFFDEYQAQSQRNREEIVKATRYLDSYEKAL